MLEMKVQTNGEAATIQMDTDQLYKVVFDSMQRIAYHSQWAPEERSPKEIYPLIRIANEALAAVSAYEHIDIEANTMADILSTIQYLVESVEDLRTYKR